MTTLLEPTIDLTARKVPLHRLVDVELRKLIDTRAGMWLLILIGAVIVLVEAVLVITAINFGEVAPWSVMFAVMATPLGLLLAVLGVMTVTSEWGQRTSLVTFSLEPRRMRVVLAKLLAGLLATVVLLLFTLVFTAALNPLQATIIGQDAIWDVPRSQLVGFGILHTSAFFLGFSFGMLIPNTPAALVAYFVFRFVVPGLLMTLGMFWDWFAPVVNWVHFSNALEVVLDVAPTSEAYWHLASATGLWVVLPLVLGSVLLVRREIK